MRSKLFRYDKFPCHQKKVVAVGRFAVIDIAMKPLPR